MFSIWPKIRASLTTLQLGHWVVLGFTWLTLPPSGSIGYRTFHLTVFFFKLRVIYIDQIIWREWSVLDLEHADLGWSTAVLHRKQHTHRHLQKVEFYKNIPIEVLQGGNRKHRHWKKYICFCPDSFIMCIESNNPKSWLCQTAELHA